MVNEQSVAAEGARKSNKGLPSDFTSLISSALQPGVGTFDPAASFDSTDEALKAICLQSDPLATLLAVVKSNIQAGEFGFASEIVKEFETATNLHCTDVDQPRMNG